MYSSVWLFVSSGTAACQFSLFKPSSPEVCSNPCPLSQWCHPAISSSILPFSSCLQSFPESRSFPMSQLFVSGGQSIGVSASASVLTMNIQDWFPLGLAGWISLQSNESALCIRWPKYWSFSFSVSPSNEYSGLISFRIGWLDLLAVQGTLKSLFQNHSSKAQKHSSVTEN